MTARRLGQKWEVWAPLLAGSKEYWSTAANKGHCHGDLFFQNIGVSSLSPPIGQDLVPVKNPPFSCLSSLFSAVPWAHAGYIQALFQPLETQHTSQGLHKLQQLLREDGQVNESSQHTKDPNRITEGIPQLFSLGEFGMASQRRWQLR